MDPKIVEALTKILESLGKNISFEEVTTKLNTNKDFDTKTLSVAYSLILETLINKKSELKKNNKYKKKFRILTNEEIKAIGISNYKYIQHLVNIGLLSPVDVELLAEQVYAFPEVKVSKDDINWIILFSLIDFDEDILPGSRVLLYSSDTIN